MNYDMEMLSTKKTAEIATRLIQLEGGAMHYTRLIQFLNRLNLESLRHQHYPITDLNLLMEGLLTEQVVKVARESHTLYEVNPAFKIDDLGTLHLTKNTVKPSALSRYEWNLITEIYNHNLRLDFSERLLTIPELLGMLDFDSELTESIIEELYAQVQLEAILGA